MPNTFKIMLVEDESLVLMLLEDMLKDMGHSVACTASELDEALELARDAPYNLAIIDINLKGQRTFPVAEIVKDRKLPLIFSTGYGANGIDPKFADIPVLCKPFDDKSLAGALAQLR